MRYMRLWLGLGAVIIGSFAVLGYFGRELYRQAPPVPERVVTSEGRVLYTAEDIKEGQNVWQSMGGQEVGHGLGPRGLRRARLVGGLAAPRGDLAPRPLGLGRGRSRQGLRRPELTRPSAGLQGQAQGRDSDQHLRPRDGRPGRLADAGRGDRGRRRRTTRRCSATTRSWTSCATPTPFPADAIKTPERQRAARTPSSSGPPGPARPNGPGRRSPTRTTGPPRS